MPNDEKLLSLREVSLILGLSEQRVYQLDEDLRPLKTRRGVKMTSRFYSPATVEEFRAKRALADATPGPGIQLLWKLLNKAADHDHSEVRLQLWDFVLLGAMPCHFCGSSPVERVVAGERVLRHDLELMNDEGGYGMLNAVACCDSCRSMKGDLDGRAFLTGVLAIARHRMR